MPGITTIAPAPAFSEAVAVFARVGLLSFGGPAGQIALMHRVFVEERKWLDEPRFLHALNYCMLLPGPEAMQLATYVGWLLHGVRGGLAAGLLFLLPGAAVITVLSAIYLTLGNVPLVAGLLFGIKAAVLAIVLDALIRVSRRALKDGFMVAIAVVAFIALAAFKLPFPIVIVAAGLAGALAHLAGADGRVSASAGEASIDTADMPEWTRPTAGRLATATLTWLAVWLMPLGALYAALGAPNVFTVQASFFSVMAMVTFGGAYAVLAYVAQQAVEVYGWLRPDEMLTGLGLAETTPGPLILVLAFVGFLGGARLSGLEPLAGGLAGALVALWFTFAPCFLWIFAGAPYVETMRNVRWLAAALAAVTAAVVGVIANLTLWFSLHVLFREVGEATIGPLTAPVPVPGSFDLAAAAIAVGAGLALLRFGVNMFAVLGGAAAAGALWMLAAG